MVTHWEPPPKDDACSPNEQKKGRQTFGLQHIGGDQPPKYITLTGNPIRASGYPAWSDVTRRKIAESTDGAGVGEGEMLIFIPSIPPANDFETRR
ncbi:hypothetical protein JTE90_000315 [Oedothorax gibbosus]|uniref:Uncharacterized protein n=1 Tax=Oedothorax gibbosus TaxID=931172 RepID=A0AAV6VTT7_9ARAC|nr:hypothetical protein JTE90_000315 [Oedothorax gibbosus]